MSIMTEQTWKRHSNPLSVWSRVLTNPLVYEPVWNRSLLQAVPVGLWFALNPRLIPRRKRVGNEGGSRGAALGEGLEERFVDGPQRGERS